MIFLWFKGGLKLFTPKYNLAAIVAVMYVGQPVNSFIDKIGG